MVEPLRFLVLQPGARLHYALPAVLAKAGMLDTLYTDIHAPTSSILNLLNRVPANLMPKPFARLAGRTLPPELVGRVESVPIATIRDWMTMRLPGRVPIAAFYGAEATLQSRIRKRAFGNANAFYTLSNADLELVREAKARGMFVVHEQVINPHVGRILREERTRYPGIEAQDSLEEIEDGIARDEEQWRLSDLVLGASEFVRGEVLEHGLPPDRIAVVPYGIHASWLGEPTRPQRGRILFVGSVGLRKGNHYLAAAGRILKERGVPHEIRVVGPFDPAAISRAEFSGPTYVGQVPRSIVRDEYRSADLFVFPTIADSFALVHLEALACGIPVVTTPNCGSVVRDGLDGWIVPIRNPVALADRIQQLLEDRALRERMSQSARERAAEFVWERYAQRLLHAIANTGQPRTELKN